MNIKKILEDIKSDRVKKVIIDSDAACELDDQYALAYSFACKSFEILSLNAAPMGVTVLGKDLMSALRCVIMRYYIFAMSAVLPENILSIWARKKV